MSLKKNLIIKYCLQLILKGAAEKLTQYLFCASKSLWIHYIQAFEALPPDPPVEFADTNVIPLEFTTDVEDPPAAEDDVNEADADVDSSFIRYSSFFC